MKPLLLVALLALVSLPAQAQTLITFAGAPRGPLPGPVAEDGFVYSAYSGVLFGNGLTSARRTMEGSGVGGGGVLSVVAANGGLFSFANLQYVAFDESGAGQQTLTIHGLREGLIVGTDTATELNTDKGPSVDAHRYLVEAFSLSGLAVDELHIVLNAGLSPQLYFQAVDNMYLNSLAVPEPTSWALMIGGLGMAGGLLRRRRASTI